MLETGQDMDSRVKRCIQTRLCMSKKFRIGTNVYSEHVLQPSY